MTGNLDRIRWLTGALLSLLLLFSCLIMYYCNEKFDAKAAWNIDKANSKIFQFNFTSFLFIVAGTLLCTRILL